MDISLIIVAFASLVTPLLLAKLKISTLPTAVAEIIVGIVLGKSLLNLVSETSLLSQLSTIGVIYLLFLSGLEIDFSLFTKNKNPQNTFEKRKAELESKKSSPVQIAILSYVSVVIISSLLAYFLKITGLYSNFWLSSILFSTIALGVVIAALKEKELLSNEFGQVLLLIAVLGEVIPMLELTTYASIFDGRAQSLWLISLLFLAAAVLFRRFRAFFDFFKKINKSTTQLDIRLAFFVIFCLVVIAQGVGAENILGAFVAGIVIKLLEPEEDTRAKLDSIGYGFLIPIFFIMTGAELNIPSLFSNSETLILIPVFLVGFILAKSGIFFVLKKNFNVRNDIAGTVLSSTTITLVLAVLEVAKELKAITTQQSGAFLLAAILSCIISPLIFNKLYSAKVEKQEKKQLNVIGLNLLTISVVKQLSPNWYDITFYTDDKESFRTYNSEVNAQLLPSLDSKLLTEKPIFDTDILLLGYSNYHINYDLALFAKEYGTPRVITRFENRDIMNDMGNNLKKMGIEYFNSLDATIGILRSLIETPSTLNFLNSSDSHIYEVIVHNRNFVQKRIKDLTFIDNITISRIFRNHHSIAPHGDTQLELNDHIIFTGDPESVQKIRTQIEKMNA